METCETVRIVGANGDHVVINKSDFDPKLHQLAEDNSARITTKPKSKKD